MTQYFHAIDPRDEIFCHNVGLAEGLLTAVSLRREAMPELAGMRSPYEVYTLEAEKEAVFEAVRVKEFPHAPSRMGAIYLFASAEDAAAANEKWWQGARVVLAASIIGASRFGSFDAAHLDAPAEGWDAAARSYWRGHFTEQPQTEVIVEGVVQLYGWEPYARLLSG